MDWMDGLRQQVGLPTAQEVREGLRTQVQAFDQKAFSLDRQLQQRAQEEELWRADQADSVAHQWEDFKKRWETRRTPWEGLRAPASVPGVDGRLVPNPNERIEHEGSGVVRG